MQVLGFDVTDERTFGIFRFEWSAEKSALRPVSDDDGIVGDGTGELVIQGTPFEQFKVAGG
jgi:hypothetical protein